MSGSGAAARRAVWGLLLALVLALAAQEDGFGRPPAVGAAGQATARREFHVTARRYRFDPARIEVTQDDLVRIVFEAEDIPHSFTIDAYRIAKRANPGQPVTFEFHARDAGRFPIYCNLTIDERCLREMRGELIVQPRP